MPPKTTKQIGDGLFGFTPAGLANEEFASVVQSLNFDWKVENKKIKNGDSKTIGVTYYDTSCEIKLTLWAVKGSRIPCLGSVHTLASKIPNLGLQEDDTGHSHGVVSAGIVESVSGKAAAEEYMSYDITMTYYPFLDDISPSGEEPLTNPEP